MTQEEQTLLLIKGTISDLPNEQRKEIYDFFEELKARIEKNPILGMGIALLGAELAAHE